MNECLCGCGEIGPGKYRPGHDQSLRLAIEQELGGLERLRAIAEDIVGRPIIPKTAVRRVQMMGEAPKREAEYERRHLQTGQRQRMYECLCGCGEIGPGKYRPGHDQSLRTAIEKELGGLERLRAIAEDIVGHPIIPKTAVRRVRMMGEAPKREAENERRHLQTGQRQRMYECLCGCGEIGPGKYRPGHDQSLRTAIEQELGGLERLRAIAEDIVGHPIVPKTAARRGRAMGEAPMRGSRGIERIDGWIPKEKNACIHGRDIGGMVYVGSGPLSESGSGRDNAFIDPSKSVAQRGGDFNGQGMSYWPNYSTIDSRSRATYLDWLSSGRSDTRFNVGYVFLYFYGLERRVFVDNADAHERADILAEVRRLLETYGSSYSIRRYLGAFIDAAGLLDSSAELQPVFKREGYEVPQNVLLAIGRMAARNEPLTADWLLSWHLCHPETRLQMPMKRAFPEFKEYFRYLFDDQFPNGLKLRAPDRRLQLIYHSASGNFTRNLGEKLGDVPDVTRLTNPLSTARAIATEASDGLRQYSRHLEHRPGGRGTIEAHALLPEAIWPMFPCSEKEEIQSWAAMQIKTGGLVPVEDVIERLEGVRPDKVGKTQLLVLADALARLGVGLAPDPRFALRQPRYGEAVVLFHLPSGAVTTDRPSEAFRSAMLGLAVGMLAAHADGRLNESERRHMAAQLAANQSVTETERAHLRANLRWMAAVPPDLSMLRNRLRNATESARGALGQLAVAAAGADGKIGPEEIRTVEKLYSAMGLERERVHSDLHALTSSPEPVMVRSADRTPREFAIPSPRAQTPESAVALDAARVSAIMADTACVSKVLGDILGGDDGGAAEVAEVSAYDGDQRYKGLDHSHRAFASVLITRQQWTEGELSALADEHQLMAAGTLETINEWAIESLDDLLIEQGDDGYEINGYLAQELMR